MSITTGQIPERTNVWIDPDTGRPRQNFTEREYSVWINPDTGQPSELIDVDRISRQNQIVNDNSLVDRNMPLSGKTTRGSDFEIIGGILNLRFPDSSIVKAPISAINDMASFINDNEIKRGLSVLNQTVAFADNAISAVNTGLDMAQNVIGTFNDLALSEKGFDFIKNFQPFSSVPTLNEMGEQVIGFGHKINDQLSSFFQENPLGIEQAEQLLQGDVAAATEQIQNSISQPLNQEQFDSLVSQAVSLGPSEFANSGIPDAVNQGDFTGAAQATNCYTMGVNGSQSRVLAARRAAEATGLAGGSPAPNPTAIPSVGEVPESESIDAIKEASERYGVDYDTMMAIAYHESRFQNDAANPAGSASGLYQYTDSTWLSVAERYGSEVPELQPYHQYLRRSGNRVYLDDSAPPGTRERLLNERFNPRAAANMTGVVIRDYYIPTVGSSSPSDVYMAHFLGAENARNVLRQPSSTVVGTTSPAVARYNPTIVNNSTTGTQLRQFFSNKMAVGRELSSQHPL